AATTNAFTEAYQRAKPTAAIGGTNTPNNHKGTQAMAGVVDCIARSLDLLPVILVCVDTLGVLTTNDESDLSFHLDGNALGTASGAFTHVRLYGKILARTSSKLWSDLFYGLQKECFITGRLPSNNHIYKTSIRLFKQKLESITRVNCLC
ncbi:hypothetical protein Tco_1126666, partial [Tanacetum coccineum]